MDSSFVPFSLLDNDVDSVAGVSGSERLLCGTSIASTINDVRDLIAGGSVYDQSEHDHQKLMKETTTKVRSRGNEICTLCFFVVGGIMLPLSIYAPNDSHIPITLSQSLILFCISICTLLTASWKGLQICALSCCCGGNSSNPPECLLSPGWAILFLFCSLSFAMLCTFGFVTYPSDITYPFGVSLLFGVLSFILFIASTIGLNRYCRCCRFFVVIWQKISFWVCFGFVIWDIVSDILAALKVYRHHDYNFFIICVTFTGLTFLLYWLVGIMLLCDRNSKNSLYSDIFNNGKGDRKADAAYFRFKKWWEWTLYFPLLSMITITVWVPGSPLIALAFSSFPQYIVSLSFILGMCTIHVLSGLKCSTTAALLCSLLYRARSHRLFQRYGFGHVAFPVAVFTAFHRHCRFFEIWRGR